MARPARILFEGAYYHVINRGQGRRKIYLDKRDYQAFLNIISETSQTYNVNIVAYCLMGNHYHLLVHTPDANLPDFMRQLNGIYTQNFNQRYKHDGPLFKGRYKAIVVQEGSYLLRLIRYMHKNPLRARIVQRLSDYKYSSHPQYLKEEESRWLKFKDPLKTQWRGQGSLLSKYKQFMKLEDVELEEYLKEKQQRSFNAIIFGDKDYMDEIKMKYLKTPRTYGEIPQAKQIRAEVGIKEIKREVLKEFGVKEEVLYHSLRGKENIPRMMAISLARKGFGLSYKEIAQTYGGISYKSAAKYYERLMDRCKKDKDLKNVFEKLTVRCSQVET